MARVLFAWEYGEDPGPARRARAIARELRTLGHETTFALRDLRALGAAQDERSEWFQAPLLPPSTAPEPASLNMSSFLLNLGFDDVFGLSGALRGWANLLKLWQADLVVADYAPAASLAARLVGAKVANAGAGFAHPPLGEPMPALQAWAPAPAESLRQLDARLTASVAKAFARVDERAQPPRSAADVLGAKHPAVCTWPELDPFGKRAGVEYLGPQDDPRDGIREVWSSGRHPRILAWLDRRDPRLAALLDALRQRAGEAIVVIPGIPAVSAAALTSGSVRVHSSDVALDELPATADLCLTHAQPGILAHLVTSGAAHALMPLTIEQFLVARRLEAAGSGAVLAPNGPAAEVDAWLAAVLARPDLRAAAAANRGARAIASAATRIAAALDA